MDCHPFSRSLLKVLESKLGENRSKKKSNVFSARGLKMLLFSLSALLGNYILFLGYQGWPRRLLKRAVLFSVSGFLGNDSCE